MEQELRYQIIGEARKHWVEGEPLEAGSILFEHIPRKYRPEWGADILEYVYKFVPPASEIEDVIDFARQTEKWGDASQEKSRKAHNFFDAMRKLGLQDQYKNSLYQEVLILAENVAKVTYNAYGYRAPFDHNAGWKIVSNTKAIVNQVSESEFAETSWSLLSAEKYIQLEEPTMCNPGCPICYENGLTAIG